MSDAIIEVEPVLPRSGALANLGWAVFRNTAGSMVGRVLVAGFRLLIASAIVRKLGLAVFGQYSLLFGVLVIAEWILDFGTTEIFVREVCREPEARPRLLRVMLMTKFVQLPIAFIVLATILLALRYPAEVVRAGLVGGLGLVFFLGVLVFRVVFKASLNMEREGASELISVIAMLPMVVFVAQKGWGLTALFVCHVASRLIFFLCCALFGRGRIPSLRGGASASEIVHGLRVASAIGVAGFLVVVYEAVDILLLARLNTVSNVAYYSGAQRLSGPLLMVLYSVGATLYPLASSYWPHARAEFANASQKALEAVMLLGGMAACCLIAGADFFLGLIGKQLQAGAPALRILAVLCVVKGISATLGPLLYVAHAQKKGLYLIIVALIAKIIIVAAAARFGGFVAVAFAVLAIEILFSLVPTLYLVQRETGLRLSWNAPLRTLLVTAVAAALPYVLAVHGLAAIAIALSAFMILAIATRCVRIADLHALLRLKPA